MENPIVPISEIYLGTRFREDYGDIDKLAYSIKKNGLISPVAIGITKNLSEDLSENTDLPYTLLAGGRRIAAVKILGWSSIPVRIYDQSISSLDLRSIELAENFDRKDMTYAEELKILNEIDRLQRQIHGEKIGRSPNSPGWSQTDTAKLTHKSAASVTKDLQLARAIEEHPELGLDKCKNKNEAMKKLKKMSKTISNSLKAEAFLSNSKDSSTTFRNLSSSYIVCDCIDLIKKLPANSMDLVEIDPPYAVDLTKIKKGNECEGYNEISVENYPAFMYNLFVESYRILKKDGWLLCWFAPDPWFEPILEWLRTARFSVRGIPGIWTKPQGQTLQPEIYLSNQYEMFFYARKNNAKIQLPGRSNIFQFDTVPADKKYHPTQRPLELMKEIYTTFATPDSKIFIPFLGSGIGLLAGHACKMNVLGSELNSTYKDGYIIALNEYLKGGE